SIRSAQAVPMAEERAGGPRIGERHLQRQVHADDRGAFKLAALPAGTYRITGDAGYFGQNTDALIVEVSEGRITTAVIKLRGENYLRGQVVDAMGMPVAGAIVQLRGEGVALGDGLLQPIQDRDRIGLRRQNDGNTGIRRFAERTAAARQFTDADGRFGFYSLQDKPYALVARLGSVEAQLENLPVNGPDAVLRLGETGGRVVSGYATDSATGLPVTAFDVRVVARADSTDPDPFTRVSPDRTFPWRPAGAFRVMDAPAEDFSIRISAPGYVPLIIPVDGLGQAEHRANVEAGLVPLCNLTVTPTQDGARLDLEPVLLLFEGYLAYQGATDE